jgi:hypothetical protein
MATGLKRRAGRGLAPMTIGYSVGKTVYSAKGLLAESRLFPAKLFSALLQILGIC